MKKVLWLGILAVGCVFGYAAEEVARLKVGDRAPEIKVSRWIQGAPVKGFEKGKVYVVEFWASWCGPCKIYVPHLNELHLKFKEKGLNVIGVAIREDEAADAVKFLREMGSKMTYRVAIDDESSGKGFMDHAWMHAAETDALPTAFVVNGEGLIAYIGHPIGLKEPMLEELLAGKFDVKAAAASYERKRENAPKIKALEAEYEAALEKKEWEKAEKSIKDRESLVEEDDRSLLELSRMVLKIRKKDLTTAEQIARDLSERKNEVARFFDGLAWSIATEEGVNRALLDIAEKAAARANAMEEGKDSSILETIARLQFLKGDKAGAIATQEKALAAVSSTETERTKSRYKRALESYQAGKLPE